MTPQNAQLAQILTMLAGYVGAESIQKGTGTPEGPYVHGSGGLFGVRGLNQSVISTHTQITGSLGEIIPIVSSIDTNPLFPYITGWLRSDEQEKDKVCDDPKAASNFKTCIQTTVFGRKEFKTATIEINRVGQRINRGEFLDLVLENDPLVNQMGGLMQSFLPLNNQAGVLAGREMVARLIGVGIAFQRWFCPTVFTGNPANNSAGGGYEEFMGLDLLISTTKVDALTGQACPSLRSTIMDFGYRLVDSIVDPDIIKTFTTMYRILTTKARQQNLAPVNIVIVMREPLFYAISEIWPCRYITYRCSNIDNANVIDPVGSYSAEAMVRMRDEMRTGKYLLIDGVKVPVVLDDCIMEENTADNNKVPAGSYASDVYFVPLTAMGGNLRTFYWEYYDYRQGSMQAVADARANTFFWSDNGVFLWGVRPPNNWCLDMIAKVEPRLILRTPQLAGRITNIVYNPLLHTDDPLPSQDYHTNGGVKTGRPGPSPYSEFNLSGPGFDN